MYNWFGVENQYSMNQIQLEKFAYRYETQTNWSKLIMLKNYYAVI